MTIDPGAKALTLYLGPYTYIASSIVLRSSFKIIGMGASQKSAFSQTGTIIQACSTCTTGALFTVGTRG